MWTEPALGVARRRPKFDQGADFPEREKCGAPGRLVRAGLRPEIPHNQEFQGNSKRWLTRTTIQRLESAVFGGLCLIFLFSDQGILLGYSKFEFGKQRT
jgi:hypothetical protein